MVLVRTPYIHTYIVLREEDQEPEKKEGGKARVRKGAKGQSTLATNQELQP